MNVNYFSPAPSNELRSQPSLGSVALKGETFEQS
jgi:hypothetical protein